MPASLHQLYVIIITQLSNEQERISEDDFDINHHKIMSFIILLNSALECFLPRAFKKCTERMRNGAVKNHFDGKASGSFSLEKDLKLFCDYFIPETKVEFTKLDAVIRKRNDYCHRMFDKNGHSPFEKEPFSKEQLNDYMEYTKKTMKDILEATSNKII